MSFNVFLFTTSVWFLLLCITTKFVNTNSASRYRNCNQFGFRCTSGGCIDEEFLCDGIPNCDDNSDETASVCSNIACPRHMYRCNYGACIKLRAKCDRVRDCFDGSDEIGCNNAQPSYSPTVHKSKSLVSCLIPNSPENGEYSIGGHELNNYQPGDMVPAFSVLITNCNYGYQPSPANKIYSICANGIWNPIPSTCSQFAQAIKSSSSETCDCHCPLVLIK